MTARIEKAAEGYWQTIKRNTDTGDEISVDYIGDDHARGGVCVSLLLALSGGDTVWLPPDRAERLGEELIAAAKRARELV